MLGHGVPALSWHLRASLSERRETPGIRSIRTLPSPTIFVLSAVTAKRSYLYMFSACPKLDAARAGRLVIFGFN